MASKNGNRLTDITIRGERLNMLPKLPILDTVELQGNLKDLSQTNYEKLVKTHLKHGIFLPFYVWESPEGINYIADGHQRRRVLPAEGYTGNVPVVYIEAANMQEAKEKLLVISSQYGKITQEGFDTFTFDLPDVGEMVNFDALNFEFGQDEDEPEQGDAEPQINRAAELQELWGTERGQLWAIGEHRLLCGDSTVREDVERVMGGERADMVFTDPPYNHASANSGYAAPVSKAHKDLMASEWDKNFTFAPFAETLDTVLAENSTAYICTSWHLAGDIWEWMSIRSNYSGYCVWSKPNPMPSLAKRHWTWASELICYATFGKHVFNFPNEGHAPNVWEFTKHKETSHPTEKPVEVPSHAIFHSSNPGASVFDGFAGSGTTLVACQNLSRRGRAIEISPAYCAVILERMITAFPTLDIYKVQ